ncbi:MAG: N-acetylmuramoyl-L-alanine amidase family protein [Acidimicrobiales bacterium]
MVNVRARIVWGIAAIAVLAAVTAAVVLTPQETAETTTATPIPRDPRPIPPAAAIGEIERVTVSGSSSTITGWAIDLDRPTASEIRISVDGDFYGTASAARSRPDLQAAYGLGERHGFTTTVEIGPGTHEVCIFTAPDDDYVTCERIANESHLGAIVSPRGVLVQLVAERENGYEVITPCGNRATIPSGKRIQTTQILIDPGHGGSEVAAVGPNGLSEKRLNLDVAKRTAKALRERGYSVQLTRNSDIRLPIAVRAELANALEPDIFLSLHHNGGATARSSVPGTQVYYQHDDNQSRRLGGILYEEMFAAAERFPTAWVGNSKDGVSTRLNGEGTDFYGIHRRTPDVTSVITEFLWLSNGAEAALLTRDAVKDAEATAIATAIDRWYRTRNRGSGYLAPFVDNFDSGGGGFEGCVDPAL